MAKFHRANGATSVTLRVNIQDSASTVGAGKLGLTEASAGLIIGTIADVEAATTRYRASSGEIETIATLGTYAAPTSGKIRFREVDATNHPGLYEIQIANARFAVAGAKMLILTLSGAAGMAQVHAEIQQDPVPADVVTWLGAPAGLLSDVGATPAEVRAAIGMSSANLDTQLAALQSDTDNIQTRLPAALVSGRMSSQVGAMGAGVITAASTSADFSTEIANTVWDEQLAFHLGTGSAGLTILTMQNTLNELPDVTEISDAVWDELLAGHAIAGSTGAALAAASGGGSIDLGPIEADLDAIKAKTDGLTFTVAGSVDSNITHVISDAIRRDGSNDTQWGGQP